MLGLILVLSTLPGQGPADGDAAALVARLGSPRYAEREAAAAGLKSLGGRALEALRSARSSTDPEVRSRAAALLDVVEANVLLEPTMIRLDYNARPMTEVVAEIAARDHIHLTLQPGGPNFWRDRTLTIHEPEPLPLWKALDRICEAAQVHTMPGVALGMRARASSILLQPGRVRSSEPVCDRGPFRVRLNRIHYSRDVTFPSTPAEAPRPAGSGPTPGSSVFANFNVLLLVSAEPRMAVGMTGPVRLTEALDSNGANLKPSAPNRPGMVMPNPMNRSNFGDVLNVSVNLERPETVGTAIRTLKGVVPVEVVSRKGEPLVVRLDAPRGETFRQDGMSASVREVRPEAGNGTTVIEMTLRLPPGPNPAADRDRGPPFLAMATPLDAHVEVFDQTGRILSHFLQKHVAETGETALIVHGGLPGNPEAKPTEVRVYALAKAVTDVEFAFENLPMP